MLAYLKIFFRFLYDTRKLIVVKIDFVFDIQFISDCTVL